MNKKILSITILIFISNLTAFSQSSDFPKIMYVNATEGLRARSEPSINSIRIGTFLHGQRLRILEKSSTPVTIDGVTNYWYKTSKDFVVNSNYYRYSWVFGGYLSEQLPFDVPIILGKWDDKQRQGYRYHFSPDYLYAEGLAESESDYIGTWTLNENTIILKRRSSKNVTETLSIQLVIIDRDNIDLKFQDNRILKLKRSNDNW
jgi:hypothetical protein